MVGNPLFGFLLGGEFADVILAPVAPCDPYAPKTVRLHH
jgi:hypothetical protein